MLTTFLLFTPGAHAGDPAPPAPPAQSAPVEPAAPAAPAPGALPDLPAEPLALPVVGVGADSSKVVTEPAPAPGQEPAYLEAALTRGPVTRKDGAPTGAEWVIRYGSGHALGAYEFAAVTNDQAGRHRIEAKRRAGIWEGITLASIGTTVELVSLGLLAGGNTHSSEGEDWLWRGATFATVGAFPIALCTLPSRAIRDRERWTSLYYGAAEADPLIDSYNGQLRARLGLPPLTAANAPAAPTVPPAVAPAVAPPAPDAPAVAPEDAPALPPVDKIPDAEPAPVGL